MLGYDHPRDSYSNDPKQAKVMIGGLSVFAVIATFLILAVLFSPRACS